MKFKIKHSIPGRLRIHVLQNRMSYEQAEILQYYLQNQKTITLVKVNDRTADVIINFVDDVEYVLKVLQQFQYDIVDMPNDLMEYSGREINAKYQEKLLGKVLLRFGKQLFVPVPIRACITGVKAVKYVFRGCKSLWKKKLSVSVLDATAIAVSVIRNDLETASSVMFLLEIGEIMEEWTHKKSVDDLARSMSLNVDQVWQVVDDREVLVSANEIIPGDHIMVHMGNVIPFDGIVIDGEAMINQASMTGESMPVRKVNGGYVYAGTVVEEGEITVQVKESRGSNRYEKIVTMIEESEKLKSTAEGKALTLADKLVPYTLLGTGLTYALTQNATKALSVLMVDFSCALKLAMPIAVLSAIREARNYHITVKGGKYMEAVAEATTIVFDKTGTLTKAKPVVKDIISFGNSKCDDLLRIAACLEEHFPHSMAKAVVQEAKKRKLEHEEMHSKVDYIVAHGISSYIDSKRVVIGSYHFVFDDERCVIRESFVQQFAQLPLEYSHLYMAIDGQLEAVILIEDPIREEASGVINVLKKSGIEKVVMMTGDSERTAAAIAEKIGVDEYYAEVLPEEKAGFIERERALGRSVIMVGDGINDSPALSAANVGIAISDGAAIAREIADITIAADNLYEIVTLKFICNGLMKRIQSNYRFIVGFNTGLIIGGVTGVLQPTTSALLHNTSTLGISLKSMQNILI